MLLQKSADFTRQIGVHLHQNNERNVTPFINISISFRVTFQPHFCKQGYTRNLLTFPDKLVYIYTIFMKETFHYLRTFRSVLV